MSTRLHALRWNPGIASLMIGTFGLRVQSVAMVANDIEAEKLRCAVKISASRALVPFGFLSPAGRRLVQAMCAWIVSGVPGESGRLAAGLVVAANTVVIVASALRLAVAATLVAAALPWRRKRVALSHALGPQQTALGLPGPVGANAPGHAGPVASNGARGTGSGQAQQAHHRRVLAKVAATRASAVVSSAH